MDVGAEPPEWLRGALKAVPFADGARIVAAVSGGGDSLALMYGLRAAGWRSECLTVAHIDHGLRSAGEREAEFVADHAGRLGLKLEVRRLAWSRPPSADELRNARRRELSAIAAGIDAAAIALAHTADDQRETKWLALARGSGLDGLAGMQSWRAPWWRPLLELPRASLRAWLRAHGIRWLEDPTNVDFRHPRARLRHVVLPLMARPLGPAEILRDRIVRDEVDWIERQARSAAGTCFDHRGLLAREAFADLDAVMQRRILRRWLGNRAAERIEAVRRALLNAGPPRLRVFEIGGGHRVYAARDWAATDIGLPTEPQLIENDQCGWPPLGAVRIAGRAALASLAAWQRSVDLPAAEELDAVNRRLADRDVPAPLRAVWPVVRLGDRWWTPPAESVAESHSVRGADAAVFWGPNFDALR